MERDIFDRMKAGEPFRPIDPQYHRVHEIVRRTRALSVALNATVGDAEVRQGLGNIIGTPVGPSTTLLVPLYLFAIEGRPKMRGYFFAGRYEGMTA